MQCFLWIWCQMICRLGQFVCWTGKMLSNNKTPASVKPSCSLLPHISATNTEYSLYLAGEKLHIFTISLCMQTFANWTSARPQTCMSEGEQVKQMSIACSLEEKWGSSMAESNRAANKGGFSKMIGPWNTEHAQKILGCCMRSLLQTDTHDQTHAPLQAGKTAHFGLMMAQDFSEIIKLQWGTLMFVLKLTSVHPVLTEIHFNLREKWWLVHAAGCKIKLEFFLFFIFYVFFKRVPISV